MNKLKRFIYQGRYALLFIHLAWFWPGAVHAYFQDLGMGVRPAGMGEAFVAVADDSNTLLYNAAGLADLQQQELNFMYSNLLTNLNARLFTSYSDTLGFHNLGAVMPFDRTIGSFGAVWTQFSSAFYKENTVGLSYARTIGHDLFNLNEEQARIDAGINVKSLFWSVNANDYTTANPLFQKEGLSRQGFTADVGLLVKFPFHWNLGVSFENIVPVDLGLDASEIVPLNIRLGTAYRYDWPHQTQPNGDYVMASTDLVYRNGLGDVRVGTEWSFFNRLVNVRLGTTVDQFSLGLGLNTPFQNAPRAASLDYAFIYPYAIKDTWGTHRVSLIIRWGRISETTIDKHPKFKLQNLELDQPSYEELAPGTQTTPNTPAP